MNIGIDVDGVLLDTETWFRAYAEVYDVDKENRGILHPSAFMFQDKYEWEPSITSDFFHVYGCDIEKNAPLKPCAKLVLDRLRADGHRLILITARGKLGEEEEQFTLDTIAKHGLQFDKIILRAFDKATICQQENIDYMIDDSPNNIDSISNAGIKCLYFRESEHHPLSHKNITEVRSWGEIYRFFKNVK